MLDLMIGVVEEVAKSALDIEQTVNIHHNFRCECERCSYTVSTAPQDSSSLVCGPIRLFSHESWQHRCLCS